MDGAILLYLSPTGIILVFVAGSVYLLIAIGVMTISNSYSNYCKGQYKGQSDKTNLKRDQANDILIQDPFTVQPSTAQPALAEGSDCCCNLFSLER